MYVVTTLSIYHSNVVGDSLESSHPIAIKLPTGEIVSCDEDTRFNAINEASNKVFNRTGRYAVKTMIELHPKVYFRVLSVWKDDCQTNGSKIRWSVPKDSKLIYSMDSV